MEEFMHFDPQKLKLLLEARIKGNRSQQQPIMIADDSNHSTSTCSRGSPSDDIEVMQSETPEKERKKRKKRKKRKRKGQDNDQSGGVRQDGDTTEGDRNTLQKLAPHLDSLWKSKAENKLFEIHCAVIVVSAENLSVKAPDLAKLVSTIKRIPGVRPVFIVNSQRVSK